MTGEKGMAEVAQSAVIECQIDDVHLKVDLLARRAVLNGTDVGLTGKELELLILLMSTPNKVVSKDVILRHMYARKTGGIPKPRIIDVFICNIRNKFARIRSGAEELIATDWSRGNAFLTQWDILPEWEEET